MTYFYLCIILCGMGLFSAVIYLASKNGSKAAQLEALKAELKKQAEEQARASKIMDNVGSFDEHTCRQRLHNVANKQSNRVQ